MGVDVDEGLDFSEDNNETLPMSATLPLGSSPHWGIPG